MLDLLLNRRNFSSMKGQLSDKARLNHILDAINEIEGYTKNISFSEFSGSSEKTFATVKQFEIIGEAANRITDATRAIDPEIEWFMIIGLRNILVHDYYCLCGTRLPANVISASIGISLPFSSMCQYIQRNMILP